MNLSDILKDSDYKLSQFKPEEVAWLEQTIFLKSNGEQIEHYQCKAPNFFEKISGIPTASQTLADVLQKRFTLDDLKKLNQEGSQRTLKEIIDEMEDEVLANAGVDVFEEVYKLVFTKLYDEWCSGRSGQSDKRQLEFYNSGQTETQLKEKIQKLFDDAKKKWKGVFKTDEKISLTGSHLSVCVTYLEFCKLFNSNLDVVDEAFEYLINQSSKGEKGQYFTPRYVIDMCVKMLNPKESESMIDTAAGSSGFPVHSMFHVWNQIYADAGKTQSDMFTAEKKLPRCEDYVKEKVFAIDFDEKSVRVARTLNLIAGDGETNVLHLNTLDYKRWKERIEDKEWQKIYGTGLWRFLDLQTGKGDDYKGFGFDIVMANPPFAGDVKESMIISSYDLVRDKVGKGSKGVGRDILFIERNLDFLKSGGRMAVVLPQGRFNNSSDKYIRDFIAERCRILAVVGLHGNTFKPHTGTKTSVLFVQKWNDDPKAGEAFCPRRDDYNIFFATMRKSGKDNSGDKIYVKRSSWDKRSPLAPLKKVGKEEDERSEFLRDSHGHLIVDHDLFNHDGLTEDGIAEAFIEFAKKENLSFFNLSSSVTPFDAEKYNRLMDELEAVEISFQDFLHNNDALRLDSDYFKKDYLITESIIKSKKYFLLQDQINDVKSFGAYSLYNSIEYVSEGIPFLRCVNIKNSQVTFSDVLYIDYAANKLLWKSEIKPRTVLLTMSGSAGSVAIAQEDWNYPINSNQDIAKIDCSDRVNPYYLYIFLTTKHGANQIQRQLVGSIQQHILLWQIQKLVIPETSDKFQICIEKVAKLSNVKSKESKNLYQQAEHLLLSELGLKDWQPTDENIAVKSFSASFGTSDRLDAEHYQPKFDQLTENIEQKVKLSQLGKLLTWNQRGKQPSYFEEDENILDGLPVVNSKHVGEGEVILVDNRYAKYQPEDNTLIIQTNDVLINGTGVGTIGRCAPYLHKQDALPDNHVTILRTNVLDPVYLSIYINSIAGQYQVEKYLKGSSGQTELYPKDIANFLVLEAPDKIQQRIKNKVEEAHQKREQSKQLLEIAKTGVEKAIEENEEVAINWIEQQLQLLNPNSPPFLRGAGGDQPC